MKKFNTSLLTAAVVAALALPSLASAATLQYAAGKQITFAKDLIVNNGTTIYTSNGLELAAEASDAANMATIAAGSNVTVKVTLTNGAKFDTTADAPTLVAGFLQGTQTGGAPGALAVVGTPYYSTSGQELNFTYTATAAGTAGAGYALQLNSMQITNLVDGLYTGSSVGAEITLQNSLGQQVLASTATIALSKWGLTTTSVASPDTAVTIDVGADPRKTLFSSNGNVGLADRSYFNAGGFTLDISKADLIGGGTSYINNYNAVAASPMYNVVATADINVTVTGTDLSAFGDTAEVWLDTVNTCTHVGATSQNGTISTAGDTATFTSPANAGLWVGVTSAPPSPSTVYVCVEADNEDEMVPQSLAGSVEVKYNLTTQRVDPPAMPFDLLPLRLNGTTLIFQNVNPAGNPTAQSFLRLTNNNAQACPVTIDAKDDAGLHSDEVSLTLGAHESKQINSEVLEGNQTDADVTGVLGNGTGKWYVRITAECTNFKASAMNRNQQSGTITDLTPEKQIGNEWLTPATKLNP